MADTAEITAKKEEISTLETLVNSNATSVTQDGVTTAFDIKSARIRLRELRDELATLETANDNPTPKRRPPIVGVKLS